MSSFPEGSHAAALENLLRLPGRWSDGTLVDLVDDAIDKLASDLELAYVRVRIVPDLGTIGLERSLPPLRAAVAARYFEVSVGDVNLRAETARPTFPSPADRDVLTLAARILQAGVLAVQARDDALAETAHSLRDPLNALHLQLVLVEQLMGTPALDLPRVRERLAVARRQVDRLAGVLDTLDDRTAHPTETTGETRWNP